MQDHRRERLIRASGHPIAHEARRRLNAALHGGLDDAGQRLRIAGYMIGDHGAQATSPFGNGDDRVMAVGYFASTGAALIDRTVGLLDSGNLYAAAALTRQLVEVEYLTWAFSDDQAEAQTWLRSTLEERRSYWSPASLRKRSRGRFPPRDYSTHCEIGGHPTPPGMRHLINGDVRTAGEVVLRETVHHGHNIWTQVVAASDHDLIEPGHVAIIGEAFDHWRSVEEITPRTAGRDDPS